jgi:hypothetical protein
VFSEAPGALILDALPALAAWIDTGLLNAATTSVIANTAAATLELSPAKNVRDMLSSVDPLRHFASFESGSAAALLRGPTLPKRHQVPNRSTSFQDPTSLTCQMSLMNACCLSESAQKKAARSSWSLSTGPRRFG